jgi:hypothetical protein
MGREHEPTAGSAGSSGRSGRILQFRRRLPARGGTETPIADPLRHFEDEEDRRRMQQNLAAAVIIVVLIVSGFWLIDHLRASARIAACVEAGHRNCVPLDLDQVQGR